MRRKVIRLAHKTLVVSLPARWVKRFGISKGDEIEVQEKGNTISISPKTDKNTSTTTVRIGTRFLRRMVNTPYRMGYNEIIFKYDDPTMYSVIENEVNQLMGFEVVSQGKNHCTAKNLAQGIETEFETSLNRLFLVTLGFLEEINATKPEKYKDIVAAEQTSNRLAHFCKRMINLGMTPDMMVSRSVYRIVSKLEEISDAGKRLCQNSAGLTKKEAELLEKTISQFRAAYSIFNRYDENALDSYGKTEKENQKQAIDILKANPTIASASIIEIIEHIKHLTEEIYPQSNSSVVV